MGTLGYMEYSVAGAAQALGVSKNTIRRRLAHGAISGRKVRGRWALLLSEDSPNNAQEVPSNDSGELVAVLMAQLAAKDLQIGELHRLLAQGALNAAPARSWWKFWR